VKEFTKCLAAIFIISAVPAQAVDIFTDGFEFPPCDAAISLNDGTAVNAAVALELCGNIGSATVLDAAYTRANGTPWTHSVQGGITSAFGSNVVPTAGPNMLVLSTGNARDANDPGACGSKSCAGVGAGVPPSGFPQSTPACPVVSGINDDVALELTLQAPPNAQGFAFDFKFFTFDYPEWVCTTFNDQFVVLMNPPPAGSSNGNLSFDSENTPVSVNINYMDVCTGCALGNSGLVGTGFDVWDTNINGAGSTRWLTTTAPVQGGAEFTLRFIIWDTGDTAYDSSVLIDNFRWRYEPTTVGTLSGE
jgi:hypothetical protein